MTGPIKPDRVQLGPVSRDVFEALTESDNNPVWKAFVQFICNRGPADANAIYQWSDRTVAAVTNALASVEQMQAAANDFTKARMAIADSFSDLEDEFIDYVVAGQQSETLLSVSCGRRRGETSCFFVKRFKDVYFAGATNKIGLAGPYLTLYECLDYVRHSMLERCKNRIFDIHFDRFVPISFIEEIIVIACPLIGTIFTVNGTLCARSDDNSFCELSE